jgi:hypothetical protein
MRHFASCAVLLLPLFLSACASNPQVTDRTTPATQPTADRDQIRQQMQNLNFTKSSLTLKQNRLDDEVAKLQMELNHNGVTTNPNSLSPRDFETRSILDQLTSARADLNDAQARLHVLEDAQKRGEDPSEIDEAVQQKPQMNEAQLREELRAALEKKLKEQSEIAEFKIQSLQQKLDELKDQAGEIDYKLFEFYQCRNEQEENTRQLRDVDHQLMSLDQLARATNR